MKLHRNAKSTPASRFLMVTRVVFEGWSYAETAEAFAVSDRTVGQVGAAIPAGRRGGARGRLVAPGRARASDAAAAVCLIRSLREQHGLPAWAIGRALRMPRSTVSCLAASTGAESAGDRARRAGAAVRVADGRRSPARRYQAAGPDPGVGHRIHGDRRRRDPGRRLGVCARRDG